MALVDDVRASRDMAERSDDFAYSNGTIARIDDEIRRLSKMTPGEQLLDAQDRQGNLTTEQQCKHLEPGMLVKFYDPASEYVSKDSPRFYPWYAGRIVRRDDRTATLETREGVLFTAPFGPRIRITGYIVEPPVARRRGLHCGDLFAPLS